MGHIFFYAPGAIENIQHIFVYANSYLLQPLFAVALAVDTFYVIRQVYPKFNFIIMKLRSITKFR